jgi:hypothetical protein
MLCWKLWHSEWLHPFHEPFFASHAALSDSNSSRHGTDVRCTFPFDLRKERIISMYEWPADCSGLKCTLPSIILSPDARAYC